MSRAIDRWFGRALATSEASHEQIDVATGIPVLGLDALASAAYGPEAALTLLIPLGAAGAAYLLPIVGVICIILGLVAWSYRQTIAAYPGTAAGSFIIVGKNLGERWAALAATALAIDYVLNVAVGISAGIGAIASGIPSLLPHTLVLCLAALAMVAFANLRGIRQSGIVFGIPTFAYLVVLGAIIAIGVARAIATGGAPHPVSPPPALSPAAGGVGAWLLVRAFASGTTAMTGIEAVSNAVPLFREPTVARARRTLTAIVAILAAFLIGVAYLCRAYHIGATAPGHPGYQTVLSMLAAAVLGRGPLYDIAIVAFLAVLVLSANTSFADFPRLCSQLARDEYLPATFADRGRRLVYTRGIVLLTCLAGALLVGFGGVTDRLIPLFAIGALLAFTMSQAGMVVHWHRATSPGARRHEIINGVGAVATGITVVIVAISKLTAGAWLIAIVLPAIWIALVRIRSNNRRLDQRLSAPPRIALPDPRRPIAIVAAGAWNRLAREGVAVALAIADEVHVVQIRTEHDAGRGLSADWDELARTLDGAHRRRPELVVIESPYREFFTPFVELVRSFERDHPERTIAVVLPELIPRRWYQSVFHANRARLLQLELLQRCSDRVVVITAPVHATPFPRAAVRRLV